MLKSIETKIENAVMAMFNVWEAEFTGGIKLSEFDAAANALATLLPNEEFILDRQVVVMVHDGVFHADDVLCVAMLQRQYGAHNVRVVRTRDKDAFENADFILDDSQAIPERIAGGKVYFDHHDPEETKVKHVNGIYKCAADKLASFLGYPGAFWEKAMYGVSAQDNGQKTDYPNPFSFVSSLNLVWTEGFVNNDPRQEEAFEKAVDMAGEILDRILKEIDAEEKAQPAIAKGVEEASAGIAIFPCYLNGWLGGCIAHNAKETFEQKILVGIFQGSPTEWKVQCIPVENGSFETHLLLPKAWRGKSPEEIEKASGIDGAVFCAPLGWISSWKTLGAAKKAARKAIEDHIVGHINEMLDRLGTNWGFRDPGVMNLFYLHCRAAQIYGYNMAELLGEVGCEDQFDILNHLVQMITKQAQCWKDYQDNKYPEHDIDYEAELDWREDLINDLLFDLKNYPDFNEEVPF